VTRTLGLTSPPTGRASRERLERLVTYVWAMDDEGAWRLARVLHQYREHGRWRAVVTYTTAPGFTYIRAEWADDLRAHVGRIHPLGGRDRSESSTGAKDNR
jgi:hypothetical protein